MAKIVLDKTIKGTILDIGGGGEGIIGRIYKSQVTAIDNRQAELDEAPEGFNKILMDACNLKFNDKTFDNVTLFYTLMYIDKEQHKKVIQEAYRVLNNEGNLFIWDADINEANPFLVQLNIDANGSKIDATYGIYKENAFQNSAYLQNVCESCGFNLINGTENNNQFYLYFSK